MKRCPACNRTYQDETMSFCLDDGTVLLSEASSAAVDPQATLVLPESRRTNQAPTEVLPPGTAAQSRTTQAQSQPGATTHPHNAFAQEAPPERKSSALPWLLGAALILGLSGIVIAYIVTRQPASNQTLTAQATTPTPTPLESAAPSSGVPVAESPTPPTEKTPVGSEAPGQLPSATPEQSPAQKPTPTPRATPATEDYKPAAPTPAPTTAPTPKPPPPRGPIAGGVMNGKAISLPKPAYPPAAKATRAAGTVAVQVTIDESGKVISARAVSGHPLLQAAAVQAAYGARFSPTQLSGQPVKVSGIITYNFVL